MNHETTNLTQLIMQLLSIQKIDHHHWPSFLPTDGRVLLRITSVYTMRRCCCCCCFSPKSSCTKKESRKTQQLIDRISCVLDCMTSLRSIHASVQSVSADDVVRELNSLTVPCPHSHTSACNACLLLRMSAYDDGDTCASIETRCVMQIAWEMVIERSDREKQ